MTLDKEQDEPDKATGSAPPVDPQECAHALGAPSHLTKNEAYSMADTLTYPDMVVRPFRYQYCTKCRERLVRRPYRDDPVPQVMCPACGWIANITNLAGSVSVVTTEGGIVTILPEGQPAASPAALPAGLIEYGESPEEAALREIWEETGFKAQIVRSLGWWYFRPFDSIQQSGETPPWPGPLLYFMFEARTPGGSPKGTNEGEVQVYPLESFPEIVSPQRAGSWRAIHAYLSRDL